MAVRQGTCRSRRADAIGLGDQAGDGKFAAKGKLIFAMQDAKIVQRHYHNRSDYIGNTGHARGEKARHGEKLFHVGVLSKAE
jgi:hypothetical protein